MATLRSRWSAQCNPAVLNFWMATAQAPPPFEKAWQQQRQSIFRTVCEGAWWGTIASEPGIAGEITKTQATAQRGRADGTHLLTGQKNFGSGSGITSYMTTVAIPEGKTAPGYVLSGSAQGDVLEVGFDGPGTDIKQKQRRCRRRVFVDVALSPFRPAASRSAQRLLRSRYRSPIHWYNSNGYRSLPV